MAKRKKEKAPENGSVMIRFILSLLAIGLVATEELLGALSVTPTTQRSTDTSGVQVQRRLNLTKNNVVRPSGLKIVRYGMNPIAPPQNIGVQGSVLEVVTPQEDDSAIPPAIDGKLLNYPNPFRQIDTTYIGYKLSKALEIDLYVYNINADLIYTAHFDKGATGGLQGMNKLQFGMGTLENNVLSAGAYFYYIVHKGITLGKGKMAVLP